MNSIYKNLTVSFLPSLHFWIFNVNPYSANTYTAKFKASSGLSSLFIFKSISSAYAINSYFSSNFYKHGSIHIVKRYIDNGSPWPKPQFNYPVTLE